LTKPTLEISITEKQILHILINNPYLITEEDLFLTETAKEFQYVLVYLKKEGFSIITEHILKESIKYVTTSSLQDIINTNYQMEKISSYYDDLRRIKKLNILSEEIKEETGLELGNIGKDSFLLQSIQEKIRDTLLLLNQSEEKKYLTFYDALDKNQDYLEQLHYSPFQTSGDYLLDKLLGKQGLVASMNILAGQSGYMKSTVCHHLFISRLTKKLPTIIVNTELSFNSFMSSIIPVLMKTPYDEVTNSYFNSDDDLVDSQAVFEKYEDLKKKYFERDNCYIYPNSHCSLAELKDFITRTRETMKLKPTQTLHCYIDLLSMLDDFQEGSFGKNKADTIEEGVNKLNSICLDTNTFCLGTVQLKRRNDTKRIETEADIEKLRDNATTIKSSGAWVERGRSVLIIHNPWAICRGYTCNPIIKEMQSPIIELDLAKSSYTGHAGERIKYFFESTYKKLYPYVEEEKEEEEGD
jgi:hypothetical protein